MVGREKGQEDRGPIGRNCIMQDIQSIMFNRNVHYNTRLAMRNNLLLLAMITLEYITRKVSGL